jgi:hypothetical protein
LNAFTNAYKQSPIVPVRFSTGQYGVSLWVLMGLQEQRIFFNNVGIQLQLDFFLMKTSIILQGGLKLDYEIIKSLKFTSQYNGNIILGRTIIEDIKYLVGDREQKRNIVQPPINY